MIISKQALREKKTPLSTLSLYQYKILIYLYRFFYMILNKRIYKSLNCLHIIETKSSMFFLELNYGLLAKL